MTDNTTQSTCAMASSEEVKTLFQLLVQAYDRAKLSLYIFSKVNVDPWQFGNCVRRGTNQIPDKVLNSLVLLLKDIQGNPASYENLKKEAPKPEPKRGREKRTRQRNPFVRTKPVCGQVEAMELLANHQREKGNIV